jgi:Na+/H+ antiporter NhaD/arsenite permease-like protein
VLLALLILLSGVLSAVLANDIVCLAMTPVLIEGCAKRNLPPLPFLLALACSANIGSAVTLIGNPQNMLIGQSLGLSFSGYLLDSVVPSALGLAATWWIFRKQVHGTWTGAGAPPDAEAPPFNARQTTKGFVVIGVVMAAFLFTDWPRELVALGGAGVLLLSRRMHSRSMLALVDWQLLVLFAGLFIVNHVLQTSGNLAAMMDGLARTGVDLREPVPLFAGTVILSNLVSNVPATMLLLPVATHPLAGPILALASTFAGNLFIVGSIANIIVVEQAERMNVRITFAQHARAGIPLTLLTLLFAAGWLWIRAAMAGG